MAPTEFRKQIFGCEHEELPTSPLNEALDGT